MSNGKEIVEHILRVRDMYKYEYYRSEGDLPRVMIDIIDKFKGKDGKLDEGDIEHGFFRSLEANFIRYPKSYRVITDVDLENNSDLDLEVCKHLVILFREVSEIERKGD